MAEPLSAAFRLPFAQQIAAFRLRLGNLVGTARHDDLIKAEHDRAFMVAGAMKAGLLADLAAAVERTIAEGGTLEAFRRDFRAIVERHGWHGWTGEGTRRGEAWRTRVIYRTNMATSYAAGRHAQLIEAGYGWWVYHHSGAEHPRLDHLSWDGLVLPAGHEFWKTHYPPNGWGCGCYVSGARSERGARRLGGDPDKPLPEGWNRRDPRTGEPPGIGKGWGYAPGASVSDLVSAMATKLSDLPSELGADWAGLWAEAAWRALDEQFSRFVEDVLTRPPRGDHMIAGALRPSWVKAALEHDVRPESAEIAVRDRDVWHTFRDRKVHQIDRDWYKGLPGHLRRPRAVLLDKTDAAAPAFILVFDTPGSATKLVVRINYRDKRLGVLNVAITGRSLEIGDIQSLIGTGVILIEGSL